MWDSESQKGINVSQETVALLSKIVFQSERGDFSVAEFIDSTTAKRFRASGKLQISQKADAKQRYRLIGQWEQNPKYGETFVVVYSEAQRPTELQGIAPYLANNVKGVGDVTSKKLVDHLKVTSIDAFVEVCKNDKEKIYQFFGEKKKSLADNIIHVMANDEVFRNVMIFLHEHNIPPHFARKIYEKYAENSVRNLLENPYRLISDFRHVGFMRADLIAQKLGIPSTSLFRLEAAFIYVLERALDDGHCCLPRDLLVARAQDVLGVKTDPTFDMQFVLDSLRVIYKKNKDTQSDSFVIREILNAQMQRTEVYFYLPEILRMEDEVAFHVSILIKNPITFEHKEKKLRDALQSEGGELQKVFPEIPFGNLSPEQRVAVEMSLGARVMILTGGPGCGKTYVLRTIYKIQRALNRKVGLCAPTGLAAKRMSASIGETAFTLHKFLGLGKKRSATEPEEVEEFETDSDAISRVDCVIVDESSMLSLDLFHALLTALGPNRRLILVGDADQLASVGAGNCLRDLIESKCIPMAKLTKIFRQGHGSPIPTAAREIILGTKPQFSFVSHVALFSNPEPFAMIPCSPQSFFELLLSFLLRTVKDVYGLNPMKDCQVLVPMRRGDVGQDNINKMLQNYLNPADGHKPEYPLPHGVTLRVGDKVIQTKNNYDLDVFNGDLGYCRSIERNGKDDVQVTVEFSDKTVKFQDNQMDDLQLCYAMTVHKSQGSEFPLCVIPMFGSYFTMLDRNLLYTAVTRASRSVILFGEDWAIKKAVSSQNAIKRFTCLGGLLKKNLSDYLIPN